MNRRNVVLATAGPAGPAMGAGAGTPRVRYGGDAAFAPFESLDADGRPRGFQIDLLNELGPVTGLEFDITLKPWALTEEDFRGGRVDLVAMVDTPSRQAWARFARGHATPAMAIYHAVGRPEPQALHDLAGSRIAVLESDPMRDTATTWLAGLTGATLVPAPGAAEALQAVRDGRADVALLLRAYADPLLASDPKGGLKAGHVSLPLQTYAFAVAPGREDLQALLQEGLDTLERNGRLEALRARWLSSHRDLAERDRLETGLSRQRVWTLGIGGASTAIVLMLGAALWRRNRRMAAERQHRQEAESALSRARGLLERSFDHHPDPMLVIEAGSGIVRDANGAMRALIGLPAEHLIGRPVRQMGEHIEAAALEQLVNSLATEGVLDAVPVRLRRADGQPRDCLVSADRLLIDAVPHVFCLVRDITDQLLADNALRASYYELAGELEQARRDIETARAAQAQAEGSLEEFTRMVAHDLKSPLNAVHGYAGLLRQRLQSGKVDEAVGFTDRIESVARRMTVMIDALAKLAQVGRQPLRRQTLDMTRLAGDTWDLLRAAQAARETEFRMDTLPEAQGDPDLVAQVWQNLLGNAAKYSAKVPRPVVKVDCYRDERGTWFRITDNGAGFDMAQAKTLFLPFQRMHSAKEFEGTGVGLSLVRRIVNHHGGEVRLRSAPGVGTVVEFTLEPAPPPD